MGSGVRRPLGSAAGLPNTETQEADSAILPAWRLRRISPSWERAIWLPRSAQLWCGRATPSTLSSRARPATHSEGRTCWHGTSAQLRSRQVTHKLVVTWFGSVCPTDRFRGPRACWREGQSGREESYYTPAERSPATNCLRSAAEEQP